MLVSNLEHLKRLCNDDVSDFYIEYSGLIKVPKHITYEEETETFFVLDEQGKEESFNGLAIMNPALSSIGSAIIQNRFFTH
jgi:hypothetical protein